MKLVLLLLVLISITVMAAASGRLVEFSYTQQQVYGKYQSEDKTRGIIFASRSDDYLLIRTFRGKTLVETTPITRIDGQKLRAVYIMDREYTQHENSAHPDRPVDHDKPLSDTIRLLLSIEEVRLLEEAAEAVGKKGLNGKNTPAALPFFIFTLRVTQLAENSHYSNISSSSTSSIHQRHKRQGYMHCADTCPPCPNDKCIGLCGKGCSCWKFVCGNCCWHQGCYDHDLCCKRSWLQTDCLIPVGFRCDQHYKC